MPIKRVHGTGFIGTNQDAIIFLKRSPFFLIPFQVQIRDIRNSTVQILFDRKNCHRKDQRLPAQKKEQSLQVPYP